MNYGTFLIALAVASLTACGKTEEAPAVATAPAQVEPAVVATPEPAQPNTPAVAMTETSPAVVAPPKADAQPLAAAQPSKPAVPAKSAPADESAPVSKPAPASEAVPAPSKPDLAHGQQIYRQACAFCHEKGVAGAPKIGDATAWSPRLAQGMDVLYASALSGKGAMPARGGNPSLAEADVKAAVDYLAAQAR